MDLVSRWMSSCRARGARDDVTGVGARLIAAYGSSTRSYHDLAHLTEVLEHIDLIVADGGTVLDDPEPVRLAAWFHDAVYDPLRSDNEEASAELARVELASLRLSADVVTEVARLVLVTRLHDPASGDHAGAVLCDADLAVLARPAAGYAAYAEAVRREYAHVPDEVFRPARAAILAALLDQPELFHTAYARTHWLAPAQRNLTAEIAALT